MRSIIFVRQVGWLRHVRIVDLLSSQPVPGADGESAQTHTRDTVFDAVYDLNHARHLKNRFYELGGTSQTPNGGVKTDAFAQCHGDRGHAHGKYLMTVEISAKRRKRVKKTI